MMSSHSLSQSGVSGISSHQKTWDLEEGPDLLENTLDKAKQELESFVTFEMDHLQQIVGQHEEELQNLEQQLDELRNEEESATSRAEELKRKVRHEQDIISRKQNELNSLKAEAAKAPAEASSAKDNAAAMESQLREAEEELQSQRKSSEYALQELTKGVSFYKRLGLTFDREENERLRIKFTQIDPAAPQKEFSFAVHVSDDDQYEVTACNPSSLGENPSVDELVYQLNQTNNFSKFIREMRKKFKQLVGQ
eukprot:gb/GECG01005433.1/.p1 GENE.gb/GECG01005433.1/~~gb/GECG01005433.1/.p1  ORF type:complete len:252 (+),score=52.92 gb/GECG01005433.1/:1-756(+)